MRLPPHPHCTALLLPLRLTSAAALSRPDWWTNKEGEAPYLKTALISGVSRFGQQYYMGVGFEHVQSPHVRGPHCATCKQNFNYPCAWTNAKALIGHCQSLVFMSNRHSVAEAFDLLSQNQSYGGGGRTADRASEPSSNCVLSPLAPARPIRAPPNPIQSRFRPTLPRRICHLPCLAGRAFAATFDRPDAQGSIRLPMSSTGPALPTARIRRTSEGRYGKSSVRSPRCPWWWMATSSTTSLFRRREARGAGRRMSGGTAVMRQPISSSRTSYASREMAATTIWAWAWRIMT